jgi:transposase
VITRHDLEDEEWVRLEPLLPRNPGRGGRWADHRRTINGIVFRTRAGCPWRDLPEYYGHWLTVYKRHRRWSYDGTWAEIVQVLRAGCDEAAGSNWAVGADSTVVRAHRHAAGARRVLPAELATGGSAE